MSSLDLVASPQKKYAVLIDADNISADYLPGLMGEIAKYGVATIRRAYGDWTLQDLSPWKAVLHKFAFQPIQQFAYTPHKNSTDSALIIDAMDILYERKIDGFCIVSSDSDFTRLASRLRESGLHVIGFGEIKTPEAFFQACSLFIYIENLRISDQVIEKGTENSPVIKSANNIPVKAVILTNPVENNIKKIPDEVLNLILTSVEDAINDNGWAFLGDVGNIIRNKSPEFDQRTYGFGKLTQMIESTNLFESKKNKTANPLVSIVYIRKKEKKKN